MFKLGNCILSEEQERCINIDSKRLTIFGGAGAGKTIVLCAKALKLKRENPNCSVIILTFTNASAFYLLDLLANLEDFDVTYYNDSTYKVDMEQGNIFVSNVDHYVSWFCDESRMNSVPKFDHILIDEATDLDIEHLGKFEDLVNEGGTITLALDTIQAIYASRNDNNNNRRNIRHIPDKEYEAKYKNTTANNGISTTSTGLSNINDNAKKICNYDTFHLSRTYRSTKEIMDFAKQILIKESDMQKAKDINTDKLPSNGIKPKIYKFIGQVPEEEEKQINYIKDFLQKNPLDRTVGIICRTNSRVKQLNDALRTAVNNLDNEDCNVTITTIHSAKGLEFDDVIIPFCSGSGDSKYVKGAQFGFYFDSGDAKSGRFHDTNELYVAMTRAKNTLTILCSADSRRMYRYLSNININDYDSKTL